MPKTTADRDARRDAKRAVKEAERAGKQARKLASSLPEPAKSRVKSVASAERRRIVIVKREADRVPYAARRAARRSSARLERVSVRYGTAGGRASSADASRTGGAAKSIERQRKQVKRPSNMAIVSGFRTLFSAITTPTDQERARKTAKERVRRMNRGD
ncbi:hypothetical protein [Agromyces bracchium]|uniref:Uncharacterized protein n=1 Tax=Agromyces bracchium TaxID=88376 RepID=A0A6I3M4U1_9MICO|nr:hypothetical protein [Agromyces bracchium]MTH67828.1 hypothetical protein [Agromyces bracchium]